MKKQFLMFAGLTMLAGMTMLSCKGASQNKADEADASEEISPLDDGVQASETIVAAIDTVGYTTTESGLKYKEVQKGDGIKPASPGATVTVHYTGKLLDGTVFDSSVERGEPATFPLSAVIKGWTEGVQLMNVGSKYQFIIPAELAYGQRGTPGGPIGPNQDLYFEIELLDVQQ